MMNKTNTHFVLGLASDKYLEGEAITYKTWEEAFARANSFKRADHLSDKAYTITKMIVVKNLFGNIVSVDAVVLDKWSEK
jgi:hypothetical protein